MEQSQTIPREEFFPMCLDVLQKLDPTEWVDFVRVILDLWQRGDPDDASEMNYDDIYAALDRVYGAEFEATGVTLPGPQMVTSGLLLRLPWGF